MNIDQEQFRGAADITPTSSEPASQPPVVDETFALARINELHELATQHNIPVVEGVIRCSDGTVFEFKHKPPVTTPESNSETPGQKTPEKSLQPNPDQKAKQARRDANLGCFTGYRGGTYYENGVANPRKPRVKRS